MAFVHYRKNYELLYNRLCSELEEKPILVNKISDYSLLLQINNLLLRLGCIGFNEEELELELT